MITKPTPYNEHYVPADSVVKPMDADRVLGEVLHHHRDAVEALAASERRLFELYMKLAVVTKERDEAQAELSWARGFIRRQGEVIEQFRTVLAKMRAKDSR